ncbi:AbrB/MazE/SpoVT family DNA-binding domain-containing protein [Escherichia coli]|nr:AbrB/MazE/SpoVT family DNA-binding domain-containing protein [Escherichia coli]
MSNQVTIKKWGNSPSVRLPAAIVRAASLHVDDVVELSVENGKVTIVPVRAKEYTLEALMAVVTDDNLHGEIDTGKPVGKELL